MHKVTQIQNTEGVVVPKGVQLEKEVALCLQANPMHRVTGIKRCNLNKKTLFAYQISLIEMTI